MMFTKIILIQKHQRPNCQFFKSKNNNFVLNLIKNIAYLHDVNTQPIFISKINKKTDIEIITTNDFLMKNI